MQRLFNLLNKVDNKFDGQHHFPEQDAQQMLLVENGYYLNKTNYNFNSHKGSLGKNFIYSPPATSSLTTHLSRLSLPHPMPMNILPPFNATNSPPSPLKAVGRWQ